MRRWWTWVGLGAVLLAIGGGALVSQRLLARPQPGAGAAAADAPGQAASAPALQFRADEVIQPERRVLPQVIEFSGPLVAPGTAVLRSRAAGTLLSLSVAEGDRVSAGQVLGRVDQAELGSRIDEREAQVAVARAALAQAERSHASNQGLAQQGFISDVALESSRAAVQSARAQLEAAQALVRTTRVAQRDSELKAPISGIVSRRHVLPGEKLTPEQQVLTLVDVRQLELAATVGTHEVGRLRVGMPVQVQVEGIAQPIAARLGRIAPAAEPGTRSIGVVVRLPNAEEQLRAGQYALARVTLAEASEGLTVPASALAQAAGQWHVWTIADGRLLRRAVTLGRRDEIGGRIEVLAGLPADARVLAARFDNLREGGLASVAGATAQAASGQPAAVQR